MRGTGIYVETSIRSGLDEVWRKTQTPALHERWDLRFSTITYHAREPEAGTQTFDYATRLGFGLAVRGGGESRGTRVSASERTSALRFWSNDALSLIREGSGYWKYIAQDDAVRFFTWYDYTVRFGFAGQVFDRMCFRPLIGWATAWSFDRLRLWIERDTPPQQVLAWTVVYTICRLVLMMIWVWHGLVPKLLFPQADELHMLAAQGLSSRWLPVAGFIEIIFGLLGLMFWRWRGFFLTTALAMIAALGGVALTARGFVVQAFNPVTLNLAIIALAAVGWVAARWSAFASRCLRRPALGGV